MPLLKHHISEKRLAGENHIYIIILDNIIRITKLIDDFFNNPLPKLNSFLSCKAFFLSCNINAASCSLMTRPNFAVFWFVFIKLPSWFCCCTIRIHSFSNAIPPPFFLSDMQYSIREMAFPVFKILSFCSIIDIKKRLERFGFLKSFLYHILISCKSSFWQRLSTPFRIFSSFLISFSAFQESFIINRYITGKLKCFSYFTKWSITICRQPQILRIQLSSQE